MTELQETNSRYDVEGVSRWLAPEDIRPGMYVSVVSVTHRVYPLFFDAEDVALGRVAPFVYESLPRRGGSALRVVEVCLPFVLVETARRKARTLDVRVATLALMSERYGRELFRMAREEIAREAGEKDEPSKP